MQYSAMTYEEIKGRIKRHRVLTDALTLALTKRARQLAREAHTDPGYVFLHAHNATVARNAGRPWAKVDYDKVDQILAIEKRISALWRRYDDWSTVMWREAIRREFMTPAPYAPGDDLG